MRSTRKLTPFLILALSVGLICGLSALTSTSSALGTQSSLQTDHHAARSPTDSEVDQARPQRASDQSPVHSKATNTTVNWTFGLINNSFILNEQFNGTIDLWVPEDATITSLNLSFNSIGATYHWFGGEESPITAGYTEIFNSSEAVVCGALSFAPETNYTLDEVSIYAAWNLSAVDSFTISVEENATGEPSGTPLGSYTHSGVGINALAWATFTMDNSVNLTAGETYWVVVNGTNVGGNDPLQLINYVKLYYIYDIDVGNPTDLDDEGVHETYNFAGVWSGTQCKDFHIMMNVSAVGADNLPRTYSSESELALNVTAIGGDALFNGSFASPLCIDGPFETDGNMLNVTFGANSSFSGGLNYTISFTVPGESTPAPDDDEEEEEETGRAKPKAAAAAEAAAEAVLTYLERLEAWWGRNWYYFILFASSVGVAIVLSLKFGRPGMIVGAVLAGSILAMWYFVPVWLYSLKYGAEWLYYSIAAPLYDAASVVYDSIVGYWGL
jgi:hypothetical protein